jgi:hypothetical protein
VAETEQQRQSGGKAKGKSDVVKLSDYFEKKVGWIANANFECVTLYVQEKSMAEELKALGAIAALQVSACARA